MKFLSSFSSISVLVDSNICVDVDRKQLKNSPVFGNFQILIISYDISFIISKLYFQNVISGTPYSLSSFPKFGQFPQLSRQLLLRLLIENAPGGKYAFPFEKVRNRLIWKTGRVMVCPQPKYKFFSQTISERIGVHWAVSNKLCKHLST